METVDQEPIAMQKTTMLTKEQAQERRKWFLVDASGMILGRLAVIVANLLRGKDKVDFTPNVDNGDYVIVINAQNVVLSGKKAEKEFWYRHSGYIGGIKKRSGTEMLTRYADKLVYDSVRGMLTKNRLNKQVLKKLFVYKDAKHNHDAQQPIVYACKND